MGYGPMPSTVVWLEDHVWPGITIPSIGFNHLAQPVQEYAKTLRHICPTQRSRARIRPVA